MTAVTTTTTTSTYTTTSTSTITTYTVPGLLKERDVATVIIENPERPLPTPSVEKRSKVQAAEPVELAARQVTVVPSSVPTYASACSGSVRYSSACSCWGVAKSTVTAATPVRNKDTKNCRALATSLNTYRSKLTNSLANNDYRDYHDYSFYHDHSGGHINGHTGCRLPDTIRRGLYL